MVQDERLGWQRCAAPTDLGGHCRWRLTGGVEAGGRSKGRGFATSFDFLPADDFGVVSGEVSPDPSTPTPYSLNHTPSSDVGDVGGEAALGRLLSPDSSPPVRCPRQRCALLPKQKHSGARRMVQAEGFGWQRCAASADLGGAAAAGVLQEEWRQETGAKGGASRCPLTF